MSHLDTTIRHKLKAQDRTQRAFSLLKMIAPNVQFQTVLVFLEICKHHPHPVQASDVRAALQLSTAAAPRHISRLSDKSWRFDKERMGREPGMGLIHKDADRFDARKHVLSLTDKGKQVLEWINEI